MGNPAGEHRDPGQEDLIFLQPGHGLLEEDAGPLVREPGPRVEQAHQWEGRPAIAPLAQLSGSANLQGMFLPTLALLVASQRGGIGDPQLACQVGDHPRRHLTEITQERAQIPHRTELNGKAQPLVVAAPLAEQIPIVSIQIEILGQFRLRRLARIAAIRLFLLSGDKLNRHSSSL